jgi:hypothetical protein
MLRPNADLFIGGYNIHQLSTDILLLTASAIPRVVGAEAFSTVVARIRHAARVPVLSTNHARSSGLTRLLSAAAQR